MIDPHRDDEPAGVGGLVVVPDTESDVVTCADWCPPDEPFEHEPECGCGRCPERSR